jgi:hypothetical protein
LVEEQEGVYMRSRRWPGLSAVVPKIEVQDGFPQFRLRELREREVGEGEK